MNEVNVEQYTTSSKPWNRAFGLAGISADAMRALQIRRGVFPATREFYATKLISKGDHADKEALASRIIELAAPRIHVPCWQNGDRAIMRWVRGKTVAQYSHSGQVRLAKRPELCYDAGCMAVIDRLIGNSDRHEGNFMVTATHIKAIDHGNAFMTWCAFMPKAYHSPDGFCSNYDPAFERGVRDTFYRVIALRAELAPLLTPLYQEWQRHQLDPNKPRPPANTLAPLTPEQLEGIMMGYKMYPDNHHYFEVKET